ncbi:MAG: transcriptional regulator [Bifidobacteriaceae bacterium]|jgi:DNA-binding transcriptional ArsR family regulator|nr:transcriptional regulator [Bifidobacteriaceae bacterium]
MADLFDAPARLRIMSALVQLGRDSDISFGRLQTLLALTPGNLSAHIKRLEAAGYVEVAKRFTARGVPQTSVRVSAEGVAAFDSHVAVLQEIIGRPLTADHQS